MRKIFFLIALSLCACSVWADDFTGQWKGTLDVGAMKLRLVFNLTPHPIDAGKIVAEMISVDQARAKIPLEARIDGDSLKLTTTSIGASYEGKLENDTIRGTFTQGRPYQLELTRGDFAVSRPQDPQMPFPYVSEDVRFRNEKAGITLAGTFTYPEGAKGLPAAILVSGSGPQNRNEELMDHKPFLVLSDYLTRRGIAVLRFDDRGVGESGGNYVMSDMHDFATDAAAAIEYLKTRSEANPSETGIVGHSGGGCQAFMIAGSGDGDGPAWIVSMAGMAIPGDILLEKQSVDIMKASGASDEMVELNKYFVSAIRREIAGVPFRDVAANVDSYVEKITPDSVRANPQIMEGLKTAVLNMASPEIRSVSEYDPTDDLKNIRCPVFAVNGALDVQVDADMNLGAIERFVSGARVKKYPGLNHLFQHAVTGSLQEYSQIEETLSEEVMKDMADWILSVSANR